MRRGRKPKHDIVRKETTQNIASMRSHCSRRRVSGCGNAAYVRACLRAENSGTGAPRPPARLRPSRRQRQIRFTRVGCGGSLSWCRRCTSSSERTSNVSKWRRKGKKKNSTLSFFTWASGNETTYCHVAPRLSCCGCWGCLCLWPVCLIYSETKENFLL